MSLTHGLDCGDQRGDRDGGEHEQTGQVLHSTESVRVAPGGGASAHREGDPQRHRGQGIGEVVHGVGEQGHRTGQRHDDHLRQRGDAEHDQADLDGADACGAVAQGVVHPVGVVMTVPDAH